MPLKSLPAPEDGPVPEDSTTRLSKWLDRNFCPPWLARKPREVQMLHEPVARAVAFAVKLVDEVRRPNPDCASVKLLYEQVKGFVATAAPLVAAMTEALERVRINHGCPTVVRFMGLHDNHHAAALAYAKHIIALVEAERFAEIERVRPERRGGNKQVRPSWRRIVEGLVARFENLYDPHPVLVFAKKEALRWGLPPRVGGPAGAVTHGTKRRRGDRPALSQARHSPDFTAVFWYGTNYVFNHKQAIVVSDLWAAWENGTPEVATATLLQECKSKAKNPRLAHLFKGPDGPNGYHPAWGTMIVKAEGKKGIYRLQPPTN
jgi:hypothetical protein